MALSLQAKPSQAK